MLSKRPKFVKKYLAVSTFFKILIVMKKAKSTKHFNRHKLLLTNTSSRKGNLEIVFTLWPKECLLPKRWKMTKLNQSITSKRETISAN